MVGGMSRLRCVSWSPALAVFDWADSRIACTRSLSPETDTPKRHYYLQSARGNRLFELGLGPVALALCGSSDPAAQARIDAILAEHGRGGFAAGFLRDAGLDWAADIAASFADSGPHISHAPQEGEE